MNDIRGSLAGLSDNENAQRQKWREKNLHAGHRGQLKETED